MPKRATHYLSDEVIADLNNYPNKSERINQVFQRYRLLLRSHADLEAKFTRQELDYLRDYLEGKPFSQMLVAFMATDIGGRAPVEGVDTYDLSERLRAIGPGGRIALIERLEETR